MTGRGAAWTHALKAAPRFRLLAAFLTAALMVSGVGLAALPAAVADSLPPTPSPATPETVTADRLPTVQIDGVVWQQVIVGDTVYAAGSFSTARPAGSAPGTNTVARRNILAYSLSTGTLLPFAPVLNAQAISITASPDGSRIYVGGDFTSVNGAQVWRVAAFDTNTGAHITSFLPRMAATVRAIVATPSTVYLGGLFTSIGSVSRNRLAAVQASNGAVLPWSPSADDGRVNALTLSPDGSKIVVGGAFTTLNGSSNPGYGFAALDTATGGLLPWAVNNRVRNAGANAAITSLSSDAENVYATGYVFGTGGNLEGTVAASWNGGSITWLEDCHGDSYAVYAASDVVYKAGHAHYCGNVGGYPQTEPWGFQRALAFSKAATGQVIRDPLGYPNWNGLPSPTLQTWFPDLNAGTYTGQNQGPWAVTGNGQYVVMGGEFTVVNGVRQQGLVRFTVRQNAPNTRGPMLNGLRINPTLTSPAAGTVRIRWQANHDQDNVRLTYRVIRDGIIASPIHTVTKDSTFWNRPGMSYVDTGLVPGQSYRYRIFVTDPLGNEVRSDTVSIIASGTTPSSAYQSTVLQDNPAYFWRFNDAAGAVRVDFAGAEDLAASSGSGLRPDGALVDEATGAGTFDGTLNGVAVDNGILRGPDVFTTEAWIRTTTTSGGKIIGFGNVASGTSRVTDRNVYMDNSGRIYFGVWNGAIRTLNTTGSYNDGQWHHVVATLSTGGMFLYVDGARAAFRTDVTSGRVFDGYWRIGSDLLATWPNRPASDNFAGDIDEVAVYPSALGLQQVQNHYRASGRPLNVTSSPPTAAFTSSITYLTVNADASGSSDPNGPITSYDWSFGDGATATGVTTRHVYAAPGTYTVRLTVRDTDGNTATTSRSVTATSPPANQAPTAAFTSTVTDLAAAFDGGTSSDPDGSVQSYAWDFGDGSTGTGVTTSHSYAQAGTYQVTLTVVDNQGATASVTNAVTVTEPAPNTVMASDAFGRSTTGGWGSADQGGNWSVSGGSANFAVNNGSGAITVPAAGSGPSAWLGNLSLPASDSQATVAFDKLANGGGMFASLTGRRINSSNDYRAKIRVTSNGVVTLFLSRVVSGSETVLAQQNVSGLSYAAGQQLRMRFAVSGLDTATLGAKVWRAGSDEPAAWQLTAADSTPALQSSGSVGLVSYLSGSSTSAPVVLRFDDLSVTNGNGPVTGTAPTASFSSSANGLALSVDGRGSVDPDGSVTAYAWDFGDGGTATGSTASHTYAAGGSYTVRLTVTDNLGQSGTAERTVTVDPAVAGPLAADSFGRTVSGGWGSADTGGAWTVSGSTAAYGVSEGTGSMTLGSAGVSRAAYLSGATTAGADLRVKVTADKVANGGGMFLGAIGRKVGSDEYRAKLKINANGSANLYITRLVGGTESTLQTATVPGLAFAAGDQLWLRMTVSGSAPTTLQAKVWRDGLAEPSGWLLTAGDASTSLQGAGSTGLMAFLWSTATNAPIRVRFDDYMVTSLG